MMISTNTITYQGKLFENHSLKPYNSWRVGGSARYMYYPAHLNDLSRFLQQWSSELPIVWLGLGSNVLIRDSGLDALIIATQKGLQGLSMLDSNTVRAEAGVPTAKLARFCASNHLGESEFFAGIPGTVGGALAMNAGAFGGETWRHVVSVEMMDRRGRIYLRTPDAFRIHYRQVDRPDEAWFVAGYFRFPPGHAERQKQAIRSLLKKRSDTQPIGKFNCGSVFRNPPHAHAAQLIENTGLKGYRVGGAYVSQKHANFIINDGHATSDDIESLIQFIQDRIDSTHHIKLTPEVHILGK